METLEDKAIKYAEGKSSSSVFREAHIRDFKAGYIEGIKDSKMLEMLQRILKTYDKGTQTYLDCQQLIKEYEET